MAWPVACLKTWFGLVFPGLRPSCSVMKTYGLFWARRCHLGWANVLGKKVMVPSLHPIWLDLVEARAARTLLQIRGLPHFQPLTWQKCNPQTGKNCCNLQIGRNLEINRIWCNLQFYSFGTPCRVRPSLLPPLLPFLLCLPWLCFCFPCLSFF